METVAVWLAAHPLGPLDQEHVLVQSNGMAEWVKMQLAHQHAVCTATQVELPARFMWRTYRQVLGPSAVPRNSSLDKTPLMWRLMRLLPTLLEQSAFASIATFLQPNEPERILQLSEKLADLFDQYQIYRPDWLEAWAEGSDCLRGAGGLESALADEHLWQPALWRAVLADLPPAERTVTRTGVGARVLEQLLAGVPPVQAVPKRVVVFGLSHLPLSLLQFLSALSAHSQVILAVANPCRFHWADAVDGRELFRMKRRRQPLRNDHELARVPMAEMHTYANPLLAAWGKQARDSIRQLDEFDVTAETADRAHMPRVDLFDESLPSEGSLLQQVQKSIRDLIPLSEHPRNAFPDHVVPASDRSIVFHSAHGLVRELEVLQDQLLDLLGRPTGTNRSPVQPRDVVVMLPDVGVAAPLIRAVFSQYPPDDARYIPFDIADVSTSLEGPLVQGVKWLLRMPQERCGLSELCDFMAIPAVAARFGLDADDMSVLRLWMEGSGIRWGLDVAHREGLALQACGDSNTGMFGLRRMLLGYASGSRLIEADGAIPRTANFKGIEPFDEIGGLDAEIAGVFANVLKRLLDWRQQALQDSMPDMWAQNLRELLEHVFLAQDDSDRIWLGALDSALSAWQAACEQANFFQAIPIRIVHDAWFAALEHPSLNSRFQAGGVTFCTLMPMRAIPFRIVCLLGMNDADFPRQTPRSDFDLMQQPGGYRPGDRSRRDDDRQLMLDALLSARCMLYVSWTGLSVADNSKQPPSVLVTQLREYVQRGWKGESEILAERTVQHPLQPFSRLYFENGRPLWTYAVEWRSAHDPQPTLAAALPQPATPDAQTLLTFAQLGSFVRNPAQSFFNRRLNVHFDRDDQAADDEEVFRRDSLQSYQLVSELQTSVSEQWLSCGHGGIENAIQEMLTERLRHMQSAGRLALAGFGTREQDLLHSRLIPCLSAWQAIQTRFPLKVERRPVRFTKGGLEISDWLDQLRKEDERDEQAMLVQLFPVDLVGKQGIPNASRLATIYLQGLVAACCQIGMSAFLVGLDACLQVSPMDPAWARATLDDLLDVYSEGEDGPVPMPWKTGLAYTTGDDDYAAQSTYEGSKFSVGEVRDSYWSRLHPNFESLVADGRFYAYARRVHSPVHEWVRDCITVASLEQISAGGVRP